MKYIFILVFISSALVGQQRLISKKEIHFKSIKQLTFGGENAEAYFNYDFNKLIFQSKRNGAKYDAIYEMNLDGKNVKQLSSGMGVTTCSYFLPDGKSYVYASTHESKNELMKIDYSMGYVWPLYPEFDIYLAEYPSNKIIKKLTTTPRYDAEATISPKGDKILFTSMRDNDLEIYIMDIDGSNQKRLTFMPGFDGGPFFNWDGTKIVWRGAHPDDPKELEKQMKLQKKDLMTPVNLDLYTMDVDGTNIERLTNNKAANFGPFFHPDNNRIIFSSNMNDPKKRNFDLYVIDRKTKNIEQITFDPTFDGFPMFSKDGKKLVFASNRATAKGSSDTNVFIADWQD